MQLSNLRVTAPPRLATRTAGCAARKRPRPKLVSVARWPCRGGWFQAILFAAVECWTEGLLWGRTTLLLARRAELVSFSQESMFCGITDELGCAAMSWRDVLAAYLVPQVMAYAEVAGLPPVTGLWAVMGPLLVYAVLGSSRQLSVGPESTTALMTATALGVLTASGALPGDAAAALAIAVGAVCLVGWLARLGFLANLLSHPILTGYMAGIAVLMIISQLDNFTGIPIPSGNTFTEIGYLLRHLDQIHLLTFGLAVLVLALLIALRRWIQAAPGPLVAVVGSTVVVALFDLQRAGVAVVGEIPAGLPRPALPDFGAIDLATLVGAALGITVVAYTDNVLTARSFAIRTGDRIDSQQEFLALGAANLSAGVLQGSR